MPRRAKVPGIPDTSDGSAIPSAVCALAQIALQREGRIGAQADRLVTLQDLIDLGLITSADLSKVPANP